MMIEVLVTVIITATTVTAIPAMGAAEVDLTRALAPGLLQNLVWEPPLLPVLSR
jgi:hypothetical protein